MGEKVKVNFYVSKYSPKEAKKRSSLGGDFFVVDISKIIKDLGYETEVLSPESEFIINFTIRRKILQGIYSTKCDGILVCYKGITGDFVSNLENFLEEQEEEMEFTIQSI
jgi:hypothetical protein